MFWASLINCFAYFCSCNNNATWGGHGRNLQIGGQTNVIFTKVILIQRQVSKLWWQQITFVFCHFFLSYLLLQLHILYFQCVFPDRERERKRKRNIYIDIQIYINSDNNKLSSLWGRLSDCRHLTMRDTTLAWSTKCERVLIGYGRSVEGRSEICKCMKKKNVVLTIRRRL